MKSAGSGSHGRSRRKPTGSRQMKTDLSSDDIIIAVMGATGSGKSSFINIITGSDTGVGHNLESCTSKVSAVRLSIPEMAFGDLVFVDTPGFDDTHKSDVDILKMVADWLKSTYEKKILLSGLLYFHRISDNRMAGTPLKNLRMFEELCGQNAFQNVILTTTMWDEVDEETGKAREEELRSNYWKSMLARNSMTSRFMRTRESAFLLIDPFINAGNKRCSLLLQKEMVDMFQKLPATSAGQELFSMMGDFVRQRQDLLRRIRDAMRRTDGDKTTLERLQREHQKLRIDLEATLDEMRRLKLPLGHRLLNMTNKFFSIRFLTIKDIILSLRSSSNSHSPGQSMALESGKPHKIDTAAVEDEKHSKRPRSESQVAHPNTNKEHTRGDAVLKNSQNEMASTESEKPHEIDTATPGDGEDSKRTRSESQVAHPNRNKKHTRGDVVLKNSHNETVSTEFKKPHQIDTATPGDGKVPKHIGCESQGAHSSTNEDHTRGDVVLRLKNSQNETPSTEFEKPHQIDTDMRTKLPSVSAGHELLSKMGVLVRQREDLPRHFRNEMQRAESDKMTLKPLQQEHQRLQMELEAIVNEIRRLELPLGNHSLSTMDPQSENLHPVDHQTSSIVDNLARQLPTADSTLSNDSIALPVDLQRPKLTGSEPPPADSTLHTTEEHGQDKAISFFPKETINEPIPGVALPAQKLETQSFHSTMLPNFRVSVYDALTTFETRISPWTHPSEWLDANTKHICSVFDGIVNLTANVAITFPAIGIFQRLIAYMSAYNMLCSSDENFSAELNATLKKYQDWDILSLMRGQGNIKDELLGLFRNVSPEHREKKFEGLLQKLLVLDSIALAANVKGLITDEETYEELVGTTGPGVQSLVNFLHARLDFPMDSKHKRLLVRALTRLSGRSGLYPESLTLNRDNVRPEHGRRARGGFADVYKGTCFNEEVALKVCKMPLPFHVNSLSSWSSLDDDFRNLLCEFITWRQISHPNVLPFYGVCFLKDILETRICLVSPWMENGNVVEFLARRNRMDPYNDTTDCVSLALDIAHAVKYLHGEKVIHRDLKGFNILISLSMRAYIADFGLATLTDSGSATTLAGSAIMGTPKWLAPELIPHEEVKRKHTYASDIYAFALVCYELFSGKVPFEDVRRYELQLLLERGERPSLPTDDLSQRRGFSPEMQNIIQDCWAQDPMKRPSADKIVERLQLLRSIDQRPLNEIGTSFFTQLMRNQVDNPFTILYGEQHGFGLRT